MFCCITEDVCNREDSNFGCGGNGRCRRLPREPFFTCICDDGYHGVTCQHCMYYSTVCSNQGWAQVQLIMYSNTPSTPNIYQVQVLVKYSFFLKST